MTVMRDNKGVTRNRKSKHRQYNGQKNMTKKNKSANNDLLYRKLKIDTNPTKNWGEPRCLVPILTFVSADFRLVFR